MLAVSLDGRLAPPQGGAAQLGGDGDRRVLEEALAWADGVLVGAETLRRHGTTCLIHGEDLLAERRRRGCGEQPLALVLSRTGHLPETLPFWRQPLRRWWLRPARDAAPHRPAPEAGPGFERQLSFSDWCQLRRRLAAEGLTRLVLLGGANLASQLLAADQVDELQLTVCPLLLAGPHTWCLPGSSLSPQRWQLQEFRPLAGDELLLRYRRAAAPPPLDP